jgi:hypothetical protein
MSYLGAVVAGVFGTAVMSAVLYFVQLRGFVEADMIRAVGSLFTRKEEGSLGPGIAIHVTSGIVFAFAYIAAWSLMPVGGMGQYLLEGLITGFAHGLVVSFILVALVAEHHPLPRFQEAGLGVAVVHLLAHVAYGIVVGAIAGLFGTRFVFITVAGG